ncbi:YhgE/Pip domain-containing protein [Clostridium paraputrificum]|uniref:YhgE/Pip domain-containing protein n=1 Tax=Clostridium paraputrificum TaxID=29363 RepID=UPI003D355E55
MNFLKIAGKDIRSIFKNRMIRVSVVAIIVVPLLYSLLYLDAFWDPYGRLTDMPVAVVNLDKGTILNGEVVNYGADMVEELKDDKQVGWKFVSEDVADKGLEGDDYYAKFQIPEDFSAKVISAKESNPIKANLQFVCNEKKNFLASQVNHMVEDKLKEQIVSTITNNYVTVAFDNLYKAKDGMVAAADGSKEIYEGVNSVSNGLGLINKQIPSLTSGIGKLSDGSDSVTLGINTAMNQLGQGTSKLYEGYNTKIYPGIAKVNEGAKRMTDQLAAGKEDIDTLNNGVSALNIASDTVSENSTKINESYSQVKGGIDELISGVNRSSEVMQLVGSDLNKAVESKDDNEKNAAIIAALQKLQQYQIESAGSEEKIKVLQNGSGYLQKGISDYTQGIQMYTGSVKKFTAGTSQLTANITALGGGLNSLSVGLDQIQSGLDSEFGPGLEKVTYAINSQNGPVKALYNGSKQVTEGLREINLKVPTLSDGIAKLNEGSVALVDGSKELSTKLDDGSKELTNGLINTSEEMGEFVSEPVNLNINPINPVSNYGTGFAPYFMSLSLWIGAIMMFFVIPIKTEDDEKISKFNKVMGKFLSFAFVGVLQAILVGIAVMLLGLKPTNVPLYFGLLIFFSLVFISIIQCLIFLFGDAGRLLSIVLLILQLTACAGTFPLELVPNFFKVLNPFMPFTYGVEALKEVISAPVVNYSVIGKDVLVLAVVFILFLGIAIIFKNAGERIQDLMEGRKAEGFNQ